MDELTLRSAVESELDDIVAAQLSAFADEAVVSWVVEGMTRRADFGDGFVGTMMQQALARDEVLLAVTGTGRIAGVSIWQDLDGADRPKADAAELAAASSATPDLERIATVTRLAAERHPEPPHVYLASMGVLPDLRGRGVGAAMLRHRRDRADASVRPAYLEASTARSRDLYARHGFAERKPDIQVPDGGPRLYPMWRDAPG